MANEESEENAFLGEIPESLFREHEGRYPQKSDPAQFRSGQQLPPDIQYQGGRMDKIDKWGEIGSREFVGEVTTTFDARPINARDFLIAPRVKYAYILPNGNPNLQIIPAVGRFTVPAGYTAILREFSWVIGDVSIKPVSAYIAVNGTPVPNYDDIAGLNNNFMGRAPCYIMALPGATIDIVIVPPEEPFETDVTFYMHGNLLLSRGLPLNYEATTQPMIKKYQDT